MRRGKRRGQEKKGWGGMGGVEAGQIGRKRGGEGEVCEGTQGRREVWRWGVMTGGGRGCHLQKVGVIDAAVIRVPVQDKVEAPAPGPVRGRGGRHAKLVAGAQVVQAPPGPLPAARARGGRRCRKLRGTCASA